MHIGALHLFLSALLWLTALFARADVRLPQLIGNGMVLQRDQPLTIWGWADAGEVVRVRFGGREVQAQTGADQKWSVTLPAQKAGGPYTLTIQGRNLITLDDVLVGDVWVCSGQSNMELPMSRVIDRYPDGIATANYPKIRQFGVATRYAFDGPQADFPTTKWVSVTPQTVLNVTAAGFFFAKELLQNYRVPIGLIKISVGGSPAEAWLSTGALRAFPTHQETARKMADLAYVSQIKRTDDSISRAWYTRIWQQDKGLHQTPRWYDPTADTRQWPRMHVPGYWADQPGMAGVNGVVWFRKEIDVPERMAGQPARLRLGCIVDRDSVYLNGTFVGTTGYQYPPRKYDLPVGFLRPGKNTLIVRIINSSGRGGFYLDKPYQLQGKQDTLNLAGEWQYQVGTVAQPLPPFTTFQYQPGGLFNGMLAPLLPYVFKGVIWYQGEANAGRPQEYAQLFPALIADWRSQVGRNDFPFLFVQLANFMAKTTQPVESNWAALREAQRKTLAVPNTGMAVAIDLGEWNDIHPLNKSDVGKRLALLARRIAYGDKRVVASGPLIKSMQVNGNKVVLTFDETGGGLTTRAGMPLIGFALTGDADAPSGQPRRFVWANARIEGKRVIVWSDAVAKPVAVRYAWADNPEDANLYNREGLPASPFEISQSDTLPIK